MYAIHGPAAAAVGDTESQTIPGRPSPHKLVTTNQPVTVPNVGAVDCRGS